LGGAKSGSVCVLISYKETSCNVEAKQHIPDVQELLSVGKQYKMIDNELVAE